MQQSKGARRRGADLLTRAASKVEAGRGGGAAAATEEASRHSLRELLTRVGAGTKPAVGVGGVRVGSASLPCEGLRLPLR